jgi:hypothetical protein
MTSIGEYSSREKRKRAPEEWKRAFSFGAW